MLNGEEHKLCLFTILALRRHRHAASGLLHPPPLARSDRAPPPGRINPTPPNQKGLKALKELGYGWWVHSLVLERAIGLGRVGEPLINCPLKWEFGLS